MIACSLRALLEQKALAGELLAGGRGVRATHIRPGLVREPAVAQPVEGREDSADDLRCAQVQLPLEPMAEALVRGLLRVGLTDSKGEDLHPQRCSKRARARTLQPAEVLHQTVSTVRQQEGVRTEHAKCEVSDFARAKPSDFS
jgi:hypothetical protein